MNVYIGCSGWSYSEWKGLFYPDNLDNRSWLSHYSKFFNFVEVDSTFYNIPTRLTVKGWRDKTPNDFRFTLKFPKIITHTNKMEGVLKYIYPFFYSIEPLVDKTLSLLIQLPPYLSEKKGFEPLKYLIAKSDNRFKYALEVRESTWFDERVYDLLKENNIALVWSIRDELRTPTIVTSDQIYIRFIGDRSIEVKNFGKIVKNRDKEMRIYANTISDIQDKSNKMNFVIAFNNHYAGYSPQSANSFSKMLGIESSELDRKLEQNTPPNKPNNFQTTFSDFDI